MSIKIKFDALTRLSSKYIVQNLDKKISCKKNCDFTNIVFHIQYNCNQLYYLECFMGDCKK